MANMCLTCTEARACRGCGPVPPFIQLRVGTARAGTFLADLGPAPGGRGHVDGEDAVGLGEPPVDLGGVAEQQELAVEVGFGRLRVTIDRIMKPGPPRR